MTAYTNFRSTLRQSGSRSLSLLAVLLLVLLICEAAPVAAQNELGVYWDAAYTETEHVTTNVPRLVQGYLVLQDAAGSAGVLGWELALEIEGHGEFASWDIEGQEINLGAPPEFVVGLAEPLLPSGGAVLLASFRVLVNELTPISISAHPVATPSVPGEMVYIPADRPGDLDPLATVSGTPVLAWVNRANPWPELSAEAIDYGTQPIGWTVPRTFTITNAGVNPLDLDLQLPAGCEGFALTGVSGPVTLAPGEAAFVVVAFMPVALGPYACEVVLGDQLPRVALTGVGREPIFSYTVSSTRYYGELAVGSYRDQTAMFRNTGEVPIDLVPGLVGCGADFLIVSGGEPATVPPQGAKLINVRFQPQGDGDFVCALGFGGTLDQVELQGSGRLPVTSFDVTSFLDFGTIPVGNQKDLNVTVRNTGEATFTITPGLAGCGDDFSLPNGTAPVTLGPSQYANVMVRFQPATADSFGCLLTLGDVVGQVPLSGAGRIPVVAWQATTQIHFGSVQVGAYKDGLVTIRNTGEVPFNVSPTLPGCGPEFEIIADSGPAILNPGVQREVTVRFAPGGDGGWDCVLDLGTTVPAVVLYGMAIPPEPGWLITPSSLVFPTTPEGTHRDLAVHIANTGLTTLDLDIRLADPTLDFSLNAGGGVVQLAPGQARDVTVRYAPTVPGPSATTLILGGLLPGVPVSGFAGDIIETCSVVPDHLDFGLVTVGNTKSLSLTVTNTGNVAMDVTPATLSPRFTVTPNAGPLAPGQQRVVWVQFTPVQEGSWEGAVTLGTETCPVVTCSGAATYVVVPGTDQLGIFFDPAYSINERSLAAFTLAEAYLVLFNPSVPTGVSGWECRVDVMGEAFVVAWTLPPNSINVGVLPEFIVGMASPLPNATAVRLATLRFGVLDPNSAVLFMVNPIAYPSIPGSMAWVTGLTYDLVAMNSITNQPLVAEVNGGGPLGIEAPTPVLSTLGPVVQLSWPAPTEAGAGCQVYRRSEDGVAEQLTLAPLSTTGTSLEFRDEPTGFAPGTRLYYSYALVIGGRERTRSPEVVYTVPSLAAARTGLLPNVPNPFNPETTIRFELAEAGHARVAIYDVTGRQVIVLADEQLAAGPQTRLWRGRDSSGRAVASGAYYVRLTTENKVDHQKIMLLK
jgi:hypothetical protein